MGGWCQVCGRELGYRPGSVVGRTDTCDGCNADIHACVQCAHHDARASNQCREPQAERVEDRGKSNFCDFFRLRPAPPSQAGPGDARAADARARLDALFRKEPG